MTQLEEIEATYNDRIKAINTQFDHQLMVVSAIFLVPMLLFLGFMMYSVLLVHLDKNMPTTVYTSSYGTVTSIGKCYSGRHSFGCILTFDTGQRFYQDFTSLPGEMIQVGQKLAYRYETKGREQKGFYVNQTTNRMTRHGVCYNVWAMRCWNDKYAKGNQ